MDFQKTFQNVLGVLQLKEPVMQAVANDSSYTPVAWGAVFLGALATSLGVTFSPIHMGMVVYRPDALWVLQQTITESVVMLAALYGTGFIAEKWFHSKVSMHGFVRVAGCAAFLGILNLVPMLSILCLWGLVVVGFLCSRLGKMQTEAVVLFFMVSFVLVGLLSAILH